MRKWIFFMFAGYLWKKYGEKRTTSSTPVAQNRR